MEIEIKQINHALNGSKEALGMIIENIDGLVFNLSLRMLGRIEDAEDAKQDILIKVITNLSSYKGEFVFYLGISHCGKSSNQ